MPVVYEVKCECGGELEVLRCHLDSIEDLCVRVAKCPGCADELKEAEVRIEELEHTLDSLEIEHE